MLSVRKTYNLDCRNVSRWDDDRWDEIEPCYIRFWGDDANQFGVRQYDHDECKITVAADWRPLGHELSRKYEILEPVRLGRTAPSDDDWYDRYNKPFFIEVTVSVQGDNDLSKRPEYADSFLELYIYEFFFVANMAVPGVAQFYTLSFQPSQDNEPVNPRLSSYVFDHNWMRSLEGQWPPLRQLPFAEVVRWYDKLNIGIKQQADTGIERAIFAIYHLSRMDIEIESVVWIFHALEALLATRVGENISGLVRRVALLLEASPRQAKALNKKIRQLYDMRSALVHGGYPVAHPLRDEILDRRLDDGFMKIIHNTEDGFGLLIAIMQRMIILGINEVKFRESLVIERKEL